MHDLTKPLLSLAGFFRVSLNGLSERGTTRSLEIKVHLEFRFSLCSVLFDFQLFTEKPVFECAFAHPIMLCLSYLVQNSMDCEPVICKLAIKWYLMHMCAS